jgi:hypothetical protein
VKRAGVSYCTRAEIALLKTHIELQEGGDKALLDSLEGLEDQIDPERGLFRRRENPAQYSRPC